MDRTHTTKRITAVRTFALLTATLASGACLADGRETSADAIRRLVPRPRQAEALPQTYVLSPRARIAVSGADADRCRSIGERLAAMIETEFGLRVPVIVSGRTDGWRLTLAEDANAEPAAGEAEKGGLGDEGYRLEVGEHGARACANTARGLLWSAMTLRQLVRPGGGFMPTVFGARIEDRPRYAWRGFMIDSGRSPNSLGQMKRIARIGSAFKLNFVVFREGDDELNAVRYRTNRLGAENPHALSIDDVADFIAYCDALGITVVPEIESLGHSTAKGIPYPDLIEGGFEHPYPGIGVHVRKSHLKPDDPRSIELLESIYDEWFALIRGPLVHLGLDEVRLPKGVQARHMERLLPVVERVAKRHGREVRPMVWSDAPPTPPAWRERVIRVLWEYGDGGTVNLQNKHLQNQRIAELGEPGCREAVIMAGGSGSKHTPYAKSDYESAFRNLAEWAMLGEARENFIGLLAVQWHGNMLDEWLPDFVTAADFGWSPPKEVPAFAGQMARVRAALDRLRDAKAPRPEEVDRPAWDGIWLKGKDWDRDVLPNRPTTRPAKKD